MLIVQYCGLTVRRSGSVMVPLGYDKFQYAVNSNHVFICSGLTAISNAKKHKCGDT